ncbi:MAG: multicopper oxidase family protein [Planctomycetota bacterium]
MLNRRDVIKGTAGVLLAGAVHGQVPGQEAGSTGPYREPSVRFDRKKLDKLPAFAFSRPLPRFRVMRPVAVGTYEELTGPGAQPFGPSDTVPIGEVFHGIAREWAETPRHWLAFGPSGTVPAAPGAASWQQKRELFGRVPVFGDDNKQVDTIANWGQYPIKCYRVPIVETNVQLRPDTQNNRAARVYAYAGQIPGPALPLRLGQPVIVRYENQLDTETSVHLHGGHSPSHSDGFPTFYVLPGKARDYFYPNIVPLRRNPNAAASPQYTPDVGESQSTMWYHDHAMDATAYNVSKGLAGVAPTFGQRELHLLRTNVLPNSGAASWTDPEGDKLETDPQRIAELEDPKLPGFYREGKEPYYNKYDIPIAIQDKVIDLRTGQIAYDNNSHNGYLGDTIFLNGCAWPSLSVENRKYRLRLLNGSNARFYRLRLLSEKDYLSLMEGDAGGDAVVAELGAEGQDDAARKTADRAVFAKRTEKYEQYAKPFLRIGKDSWMWPKALTRKSVLLGMANRADIVIDFKHAEIAAGLKAGEQAVFYLVNTMPQADGRGPKGKLDDAGDPRVLPLPFDFKPDAGDPNNLQTVPLVELEKPIALLRIVVEGAAVEKDARVEAGTDLLEHDPIEDHEIVAVREFIFERGKGAWQINGRFYDPTIANATPTLGTAEEWVLRNGGGGWWHPIHIHLESHQLVGYEKDFLADDVIDIAEPPGRPRLDNLIDITKYLDQDEYLVGLHDTMVLGPNTAVRIRMRFRTWNGPFVFHCHNLEHEDMRMMFNFEPVPRTSAPGSLPPVVAANVVPNARTHGNDVTWQGTSAKGPRVGELPWDYRPVPEDAVNDAGINVIPPRTAP